MEETIFSIIDNSIYNIFINKGFYYEDHTFINVFRWLWNEKHMHPRIEVYPYDPNNKCRITLTDLNRQTHSLYGNSYDDAIIMTVKHIAEHIDIYIKNKNA